MKLFSNAKTKAELKKDIIEMLQFHLKNNPSTGKGAIAKAEDRGYIAGMANAIAFIHNLEIAK